MFWPARHKPQIGETLWQQLLADYPFLGTRSAADLTALRSLTNQFLASKQFAGAEGLMIDDYRGAAIAVQACLPVLHLGLQWYDDFEQIIVYPDQFRVRGAEQDELGLVHETDEFLAGQTIASGPVVLSWADVQGAPAGFAFNVVIHEFVHKLDLRDGEADGCPPLPSAARRSWLAVLSRSYDEFTRMCDEAQSRVPASLDPDSDQAFIYFQHLPLDPYAAYDHAEFFAVCGEALFTAPDRISSYFPDFYHKLKEFFKS